jgi:hypothetical protein
LYDILIEFGITTKLVTLIKMCLYETYSEVRIGKHFSESFPIRNVLKSRRCSITTAFQLCFGIFHLGGLGKPGGTEIEWDSSASGLR